MPNWVGPAVTVGLAIIGAFIWLIRQYVQNQIDIVKRDIVADMREQRAHLEGSLNVMREQHKNLLESSNAEMGRIRMEQQKTERRLDIRLTDVERITGKAKMFNTPEGE